MNEPRASGAVLDEVSARHAPAEGAPSRDARVPVVHPESPPASSLQFENGPFHVLNGAVYFNGECDSCRPYCGAVCCRGYAFVSITEEEAASGRYTYKAESPDCDCAVCRRMRDAGVQYALYKRHDGSCIYLDGSGRCSIYEARPETCRRYSCVNVPFALTPV